MLKEAVKGRVPLVHARISDTIFTTEILNTITGETFTTFPTSGGLSQNTCYVRVSRAGKGPDDPRVLYKALMDAGSCLVYTNIQAIPEEFLDVGEIGPPAILLKKMLKAVLPQDTADDVSKVLGGLSLKDAMNVIRITRARDNKIALEGVITTRRQMMKESQGLSLIDTYMPAYMPDQDLEFWAAEEKKSFLHWNDSRLRARGVLFDGPPGCGKTQGAKYLANQWGIPLYRLGATFLNMYVGNSEGNFDRALGMAERGAPCVLLIDEIEKFFSGSKNAVESSGTMSRVMGSLLWWLQEHESRVLTVMTTNNRQAIPPELYREGRIDRVFEFKKLHAEMALKVADVVFKSYVGELVMPNTLHDAIASVAGSTTDSWGDGISHTKVAALVRDYVKKNHGE